VARILLARHGESDWNREGRWQGHADRPLTSLGREQARALAARLAATALDAVYASDLERARATAEAVALPRRLEVRTRGDLREVDVGTWTGLSWPEVTARYPDGYERWQHGRTGWEGGESYEQMGHRVVAAVAEIGRVHEGGTILVVCHGGPIRAVLARAAGIELDSHRRHVPVQPNAGLAAVAFEDGAFRPLDAETVVGD
jgi:broad specificity phosphatase PhoE